MKTKDYWIKELDLQQHAEGGYFKETYRSSVTIDLKKVDNKLSGYRNLSTGIYFLIESGNFSAFHKIKSDEMWHFYSGDPLIVHMIDENGSYSAQIVGSDPENGEKLQFVVPANVWFASEVKKGGTFSLVGCTVSFGFDFEDFELADASLIKRFPQHQELISRLIRI